MRPERIRALVVVVLAVLTAGILFAALGLIALQRGSTPPPPAAAPPPAPAPSQPTSPPPQEGPPVLAVKIDNVREARPASGIGKADLVYVEPVEGGLSRIAAVFGAQKPPVVGPVRSARETDLELLPQFGRPTLAFSGSAPELVPLIEGASLQDASHDKLPGAYYRDNDREIPHNLFARTDQLPQGAGWAPGSQLRFGPAPGGGTPAGHQDVRYQAAVIGFDWSAADGKWLMSLDGSPYTTTDSGRVGASTVVVQTVKVRESAFRDVAGSSSPFAETIGSGKAQVFRDGQVFEANWSRPSAQAGTTYTTPTGQPLPFAPGQVWTVLKAG